MNERATDPAPRAWRSHARSAAVLLAVLLLAAASLACSLGGALTGDAGPTPTRTRRATFTPLPNALTTPSTASASVRGDLPPGVTAAPGPAAALAPPAGALTGAPSGAQGETSLLIYATETPTPSPTPTRGPASPTPTEPKAVTPQPTPYIVIQAATMNGRRGPGTEYEKIGEAKQGQELFILGRTADGAWLQVCCMANQPVWVSAELVETHNSVETAAILTPPPVPLPTPTQRPVAAAPSAGQNLAASPTPAGTPLPPFDVARGPEFPWTVNNGILTIWVKVYEGPADNQKPLSGYTLVVKRDGFDVSKPSQSFNDRPFDSTGPKEGNYEYNLKYELYDASESEYEIYLARPGGFRVSPITRFTTKGASYRNLIVFIAYWLAR